jgi:hypothetical protein
LKKTIESSNSNETLKLKIIDVPVSTFVAFHIQLVTLHQGNHRSIPSGAHAARSKLTFASVLWHLPSAVRGAFDVQMWNPG